MAVQIPQLSAPVGYRPQACDISVVADLLDFYLLRERSPRERLMMGADLINSAKRLSLHCLTQQFSALSPQQFARKIAETWLQEDCPDGYFPTGDRMTWIQNSPQLATQLHPIFEQANIPYYVTGGVAAIAYGDPRTTRDLDLVIQIARTDITKLQALLEAAGFYVAGTEEVADSSMNTLQITHIETIARADLMVAEASDYAQAQFDRKRSIKFPIEQTPTEHLEDLPETAIYLVSPEDLIINKLRWGKGSDSQKQQRDVLAILKVQQTALDYAYMRQWAAEFGIIEALETLITAAGIQDIEKPPSPA